MERVKDYGAKLNEPLAIFSNESLWLAARMYREFCERDEFSSLALERTVEILKENFTEPFNLNDLGTCKK